MPGSVEIYFYVLKNWIFFDIGCTGAAGYVSRCAVAGKGKNFSLKVDRKKIGFIYILIANVPFSRNISRAPVYDRGVFIFGFPEKVHTRCTSTG